MGSLGSQGIQAENVHQAVAQSLYSPGLQLEVPGWTPTLLSCIIPLFRGCGTMVHLAKSRHEKPSSCLHFFFFKGVGLFIYLFLAVLGLRFCARAFSSCGKWGPLFIAVSGPLAIAASLAAKHRLQTRRLSNCGSWAQLLRGMWDLPRTGLEPMSPALAGRFSTTAPPGKPLLPSFF